MIVMVENPMDSTKKLLELASEFIKLISLLGVL